jgi:mono/diheme cytochrome c family protein
MMKKFFKWFGIVLGVVLGLVIVVVVIGTVRASGLLTQKWEFEADTVQIPSDAEAVAHGQYLVTHFMLCSDCHGADLGGAEFFTADEGAGTLWAPNLTSGKGGIGGTYTDADWLRALRHGIRPNGENLIIMPAEFYTMFDINDIADTIAYLKTLSPVDREIPARKLAFMPKVMLGLGVIPATEVLPAHKIDHAAVPQSAPVPGETVEYGQYMAMVCTACHGEDLAGMPPNAEGDKPAPNLTPSGELGKWTEAEFITTLQTGLTPEGDTLDPEQMPWSQLGTANVEDLRAIWMYLQSLPTKVANP